jgi:hypothetical protein
MGDGWAWVSLSAYSEELSSDQIRDLLPGSEASRGSQHLASVQFRGTGRRASLAELVQEVAEYLGSHGETLRDQLGQADFQLRIGWSPLSPQECIALPSAFLSVLAELHVDVTLDTYDSEA